MAGINMPGRKPDALERLAQGLGIAHSVLGIGAAVGGIAKEASAANKAAALDDGTSQDSLAARDGYKALGLSVGGNESSNALTRKYGELSGLNTKKFEAGLKAKEAPAYALTQKDIADKLKEGVRLVPPGKGNIDQSFIGPDGKVITAGFLYPPKEKSAVELERSEGTSAPGFSIASGAKPTKDDVKQVKDINQARLNLQSSASQLRGLVEKHGSEVQPGPIKDEMKRLVGDITLGVKDVARLGQLTNQDYDLLLSQVPDPTGWGATFSFNDTLLKSIDDTISMADQKVANAAQARGMVANAGPKRQAPSQGQGGGDPTMNSAVADDRPQDPSVSDYAAKNKLPYSQARTILIGRGYKPNE
jgi:hypothetical protein